MVHYAVKILVSAILIVAISEIGKKSTLMAAVLASLPLTSILAIVWLYAETNDVSKVMDLSIGIFWVVLPSLVLFLALYFLLKSGLGFYPSIILSVCTMAITYKGYIETLKIFGVRI